MLHGGKGKIMMKVDKGQIEARTIAMGSRDEVLVKYLWERHDIHKDWAMKIIEVWPDTCRERHGGFKEEHIKAFRAEVKNQMVFPAFYGSAADPIARALEMPITVFMPLYEEFWDLFSGVKRWQREVTKFYEEYGYVETLTGFRRYAPLSQNMLINSISQSTASDILVDDWNRLNKISMEREDLNFSPVFNIHDDLTFIFPEKDAGYYLPIILRESVSFKAKWVNVPIVVEAAIGPNWHEMEKLGEFSSDRITGITTVLDKKGYYSHAN